MRALKRLSESLVLLDDFFSGVDDCDDVDVSLDEVGSLASLG